MREDLDGNATWIILSLHIRKALEDANAEREGSDD